MKKLGQFLSLCVLLMIMLSFFTVSLHFFFNIIFIALQEFIIYLHSCVFMLGIVYAFHYDKHVRIDVFYQKYNEGKKKKINKFGSILLLIPFFAFLFYVSFDYVLSSWEKFEKSAEAGGLPFVYLLKSLILILPVSMLFYSMTKLLRKN